MLNAIVGSIRFILLIVCGHKQVALENAALRQQLAVYKRVHGEFLLTLPSVFDRAHDNVAANGTIEESSPSIQMFRSAFPPSAPSDSDARCSSL